MPITGGGGVPEVAYPIFGIGGCQTDDYSTIRILNLPSDADENNPVTFHDQDGNNYQVPADTVFVTGLQVLIVDHALVLGRIGESDGADGALTREVLRFYLPVAGTWYDREYLGYFTAGKYVTAETGNAAEDIRAGCLVYGLELPV